MSTGETTYLLSVPGTDQTRELTRDGLLKELVRGEITTDHWVWSPEDSDWKQISDLPALRAAPAKALVQNPASATPERNSGLKATLQFAKGAPDPAATATPALTVKANPILSVKSNPTVGAGSNSAEAVKASPALTVRANPALISKSAAAPSVSTIKAGVPALPQLPAALVAATPPPGPMVPPTRSGVPPLPQAAAAPVAKTPPKLTPKMPSMPGAKGAPALGSLAAPPIAKNLVHEAPKLPAKKKRLVNPVRNPKVHEEGTISYFGLFFVLLYLLVAGIIGANYLMVDKPLDESMAHTPFVLAPVHAHLGSFVQPNALVIHILPSPELTDKNLADYLQLVAKSTPAPPFHGSQTFDTVALTSAWFGEYALTGADWEALGKMTDAKTEERREFITDHLCTVSGQRLIHKDANLGGANLDAERDKVWQEVASHFSAHT